MLLSIEDDGCGFDTSCEQSTDSEGGRGLVNMKRRANLLGAQLSIDSMLEKEPR